MKRKLLLTMLFIVGLLGMNAQTWTPPTLTGEDPVSGTTYKLYNVGAEKYVNGGQAWFWWSTTAILSESGLDFTLSGTASSFTLTSSKGGFFTSGNEIPGDAMHVDGSAGKYGCTKLANGNYHIHDAGGNANSSCWGYIEYNSAWGVVAHADAATIGANGEWAFISANSLAIYDARVKLYNLLQTAYSEGVNTNAASAVYNKVNATVNELEQASTSLNLARLNKFLEGKTASKDNPIDITEYVLVNPDFEVPTATGLMPPGWEITIGGQNLGQQNRKDTNPITSLAINNFIEAWDQNALTPGVIAQIVSSLLEGTYVLECDASVCHDDPDSGNGGLGKSDGSDIKGAYLFIKSSLKTEKESLGNRRLDIQHYSVTFSHGGEGEVQFGLMATNEINANWLSADNFKIYYAGPMDLSVYKDLLAEAVANFKAKESGLDATAYAHLEEMVDDLDDTYSISADYKTAIANINTISDYADALVAAYAIQDQKMNADVLSALQTELNKAATISLEDMPTATSDLTTLTASATTSIDNYEFAKTIITLADGYDEPGKASYAADETVAAIKAAYDNGTLTKVTEEQVAAITAAFIAACKAQVQPADGCNMTAYIVNPRIDGNVDGWTCDRWGGYSGGPLKPSGDAMEFWGQSTVNDAAAGKGFDYYQTITGLPVGAYVITAYMFNSTNGEESEHEGVNWNGGGNAGLYGKTASQEVQQLITQNGETFNPYITKEILVIDGELRIGVKNIAPLTGRWFAADDFQLFYARQLTAEEKESIAKENALARYTEALIAAKAIEEGSIPTTAYNNLQDVITNNTLTDGTSAEYNDAADALEDAANDATPLIEPYAAWKPLKTAADAIVAETGNTKLQQKFAAFEAGVEAATTAGDLSQLVTLAQGLLNAYNDWMALKGKADILKAVANDNADANTAFKNAINTQTAAAVSALDEANPVQAIAKVQAATAALKGAMITYVGAANPVGDGAKFDLTWMLTNPDLTPFWGGEMGNSSGYEPWNKWWGVQPAGWFTDQDGGNFQVMTNASVVNEEDPENKKGIFMEYYYIDNGKTYDNGKFNIYIKQTLPVGTYTMSCYAFAKEENYSSGAPKAGVFFYANDTQGSNITSNQLAPAEISFINDKEQEVKIGLKPLEGNTYNWMGIGYVELYKVPTPVITYDINVASVENATVQVTVDDEDVVESLPLKTVTLSIEPKAGYYVDLESVTVIYGDNVNVDVANPSAGIYTFQMPPANVNVTIVAKELAKATMSITAAKYATFIAPFAVAVPAGVTASTVDGAGEYDILIMNNVGANIPANTPVVLYSETTINETFSGIPVGTEDSYTVGWLTGVYTETSAPEGSYVLQKLNDHVAFYIVEEGKQPTIPANRAYLTMPYGANVFYFPGEEGGVTAIEGFDALTSGEFDAIYTASGVKVDALQKGLNIVVRGDKSYKIYVK